MADIEPTIVDAGSVDVLGADFAKDMEGQFKKTEPVTTTTQTDTTAKTDTVDYTPFIKELGFENVDALKAKLTAQATGTPDYTNFLKENFGVESVEPVKQALEKATQYETILPEYNTLKGQTLTPFAKIANELEQKGVKPATIARFHGLDLNALSPEDALSLAMEVETPQLTKPQRDALIESKYGTSNLADDDVEKTVREANKVKDAAIARGELAKHIAQVFNPSQKAENPELLAREESRKAYWQSNIGKVDEGIFKIERPLEATVPDRVGTKKIELPFSYTIPDATKTVINNELKQMIANNPELFTPDGKGLDNANIYIKNRVFALEGNNMLQKFAEHTKALESKINEHYATLLHNPIRQGSPQNISANLTAKESFNKNAEAAAEKLG